MRFLILAAIAGAVALPTAASAQNYGGRGYGYGHGGYGYNNREVRQEQRECRRELRRADSRWEYQRELRECRREIAEARRDSWRDRRGGRGYGNGYYDREDRGHRRGDRW
jgi:hypothetical protein